MSTDTPTLQWTDAAAFDEVPQDDVIGLAVEGRDIALYGVDGAVYATDNLCTHGHARLCDGFLDGHEIECPLHQGKFDVRSGAPTCQPVTDAVRTYPVRIEGGRVYLALN
jgi:naphthalene 1,2-dioxygenase system ferredoxin subunit